MKILVQRDSWTDDATLGKMFVDGAYFGYTCEDKDRQLEENPDAKIVAQTAIPRGEYRVVMSFSHHFGRDMPELLGVPGYAGVRIHGGNGPADTEGCILLGRVRTLDGCANCAERNAELIKLLEAAEENKELVTLEVA